MLQKLALTIVLIAVAWMGLKYFSRLGQRSQPADLPRRSRRSTAARASGQVYETEKCSVCGAYVAAGETRGCGRGDCPYR